MRKFVTVLLVLFFTVTTLYSGTISMLEKALEKNPKDNKIRYDLANEYYENSFYKKSIKQFKILINKNFKKEYSLYSVILSYLKLNRYKEAKRYTDRLNNLDRNVIKDAEIYDIYYNVGIIALNNQKYDYSKKIFLKIYSNNRSNFRLNTALGVINFPEKEYEISLEYFKRAYKNMPNSYSDKNELLMNIVTASLNHGQELYYSKDSKKREQALSYFQTAINYQQKMNKNYSRKKIDKWIYAYFMKAKMLSARTDLDEAKDILFFIYSKKPDLVGLTEELGNLAIKYQERKDYLNSIRCYSRVIRLNSNDPTYLYNIATYYIEKKKYKAALKYLDKCLKIDYKSKYLHIYSNIMDRYLDNLFREAKKAYNGGRRKKAYIALSKILYHREKSQEVKNFLSNFSVENLDGNNYFIKNKIQKEKHLKNKANKFYEKALTYYKNENYKKSYLSLKRAFHVYYPFKEARELYLKVYPNVSIILEENINMIDDYIAKGEIKEAEKLLDNIKNIANSDVIKDMNEKIDLAKKQTEYNRITTYLNNLKYNYNNENYDRAEEYVYKVLNLDRDNKEAKNYLTKINRIKRKQIQEYKNMYNTARKNNNTDKMYDYLNRILMIDKNNSWARSKINSLAKRTEEKNQKKAQNYYHRGIKYYTSAEYKKAINMWEKVLKVYGNYKNTKEYIKRAKERL